MPWYMQIVIPVFTFLGGVWSRWYFDRRIARTALYRDVLASYLDNTKCESGGDVTSIRLFALQRSGALRLNETEFKHLLADLHAHGKPAPEDEPVIAFFGIRESLNLAQKHGLDLSKPEAIQLYILKAMARVSDKGRPIDQRSVLQEMEPETGKEYTR